MGVFPNGGREGRGEDRSQGQTDRQTVAPKAEGGRAEVTTGARFPVLTSWLELDGSVDRALCWVSRPPAATVRFLILPLPSWVIDVVFWPVPAYPLPLTHHPRIFYFVAPSTAKRIHFVP